MGGAETKRQAGVGIHNDTNGRFIHQCPHTHGDALVLRYIQILDGVDRCGGTQE